MADENLSISAVREDHGFQRIFWKVERVAWVLLALIPLVALAGVFGHGYLGDYTARATDGSLAVEYERFQRQSVQARYVFRLRAQGQEPALRLSSSFQHSYEIQSMQPAPARARADAEGIDLFFHAPASGELVVVVWCTPRTFGSIDVAAQAGTGAPVRFPILIYP